MIVADGDVVLFYSPPVIVEAQNMINPVVIMVGSMFTTELPASHQPANTRFRKYTFSFSRISPEYRGTKKEER